MSELSALCESKNVEAIVLVSSRRPPAGWPAGTQAFDVTLTYNGTEIDVPFYSGPGNKEEPTAADVLYCLLSDASSVRNARDFEEWATELGFDTASRAAEATYNECVRLEQEVSRLLGEDFETFLRAEH